MADIQQSMSGGASSIKNTISKVGAWAKAHPLPATLIVVVLVVIGWFVYKNSTSSSGSASAVVDPNTSGTNLDQSGTGGLTTSAGGDGSSFFPPTSVPPSNIAGVPPAISPVDYSNFTDTGAITPIPYVDTFAAPAASGSLATGYKGGMDNKSRVDTSLIVAPILSSNYKSGETKTRVETKSASVIPTASQGAKSGRTISRPVPVTVKTPAQIAGLSTNYTGWWNNIYYLNGYISNQGQKVTGSKSGTTIYRR